MAIINELRVKRTIFFGEGGNLIIHGGGTKFILYFGVTGLDGGGQPLNGVKSPPSPPCWAALIIFE